VDVAARQAIVGAEASHRGENLVLKPLPPLEIRLFLSELRQELAHEGGQRGIALGRLDAGAPIDRVR